eukprot:1358102-Lingulodinium_polyedra.AAC.1
MAATCGLRARAGDNNRQHFRPRQERGLPRAPCLPEFGSSAANAANAYSPAVGRPPSRKRPSN